MDAEEQKIRDIVRDELQRARARRTAARTAGGLAADLRAALATDNLLEVTTAQLVAAVTGKTVHEVTRGEASLAGVVLRQAGWTVVRRLGSGARPRVYSKPAARAA